MKVKFFYKKGWSSPYCELLEKEKYKDIDIDEVYSVYLVGSVFQLVRSVSDADYELEEIEKVENGEEEYFETGTEVFITFIYKDRIEFLPTVPTVANEEDSIKSTCTVDEYKRLLIGKKAFLMLPKEVESYLEVKINDL